MDYGFDELFSGGGGETPKPEDMIKEALKEGTQHLLGVERMLS